MMLPEVKCYQTDKISTTKNVPPSVINVYKILLKMSRYVELSGSAKYIPLHMAVKRICFHTNLEAYMAISFARSDFSLVIHVRSDVEDLLSDPILKSAFNYAVLHKLHHITIDNVHVDKFVEQVKSMNLAPHLPEHALRWFAELVIAEGFNNEYLLDLLRNLAWRSPDGRYMVLDKSGVLPLPGVVWIMDHKELEEISRTWPAKYPILNEMNHKPYFTYTPPCLWKALAWGLGRPPANVREALRAMGYDFQIAKMMSHIKYDEKILKSVTADQAKDWVVQILTSVCGLSKDVAEKIADKLAKKKAVVYREVLRRLEIDDPTGGEPCVLERLNVESIGCPAPGEGEGGEETEEGGIPTPGEGEGGEEEKARRRIEERRRSLPPIRFDPKKVLKGGKPPGHGWAPYNLDFTIKRLKPPKPIIGSEIWQTPSEEGRPEWRIR